MVLGMDYPSAHPPPCNTGYGQPGGYGSGYGSGQPYQPTGYPYMGYGNVEEYGSGNGHSSSLQQVRLYPNSVLPLPSKQHMVVPPQGYNYDHGIKPHGYDKPYGNSHGYEKHGDNTHGYEKHGYGNNTLGDYEKHAKTDCYGNNNHGGYDKHSNGGYDKHSNGGYDMHSNGGYDKHSNGGYGMHSNGGHEGYGKYPSHGANRVESMSYNYYSANGQEKKSHDWIRKGIDD